MRNHSPRRNPFLDLLKNPGHSVGLSVFEWDITIRQARRAGLLPRLAVLVRNTGCWQDLPPAVAAHLQSALEEQQHLRQATRFEINCLLDAFEGGDYPVVLLKGAAYEAGSFPPSAYRLFNDIDVLVPHEFIEKAELSLMTHGWAHIPIDEYDDNYYRRWMHEIPPMRHLTRHSVVDLHHTIVPLTSRIRPDIAKILSAIEPCPLYPGAYVLSAADRILHSAAHLFLDGEFDKGLRDLIDIQELIRFSIHSDQDWIHLQERAKELDLLRPLGLALRYVYLILDSDIPESMIEATYQKSKNALGEHVDDFLFLRGLMPSHPENANILTSLARNCLYVRGHWLRMPPHLLIPHLFKKGIRKIKGQYFGLDNSPA